jgi:predicted MFS family arabinose efflux permease
MRHMNKGQHLGLAGGAAIAVVYGLARYGYGLFVPALREEFGLSEAVLGLIAGGSYAGCLAALVAVYALSAYVGPKPLVVTGGLSAFAGMALIAFSPNVAVLALGIILAGTGVGWAWPPYNDAAELMVEYGKRSRVLSFISTGQIFGMVAAAVVAYLATDGWRAGWLSFAAVALVVTAWNAWLLPGGLKAKDAQKEEAVEDEAFWDKLRSRYSWLLREETEPLFVVALLFGAVVSVYFSFAVDLVSGSGPLSGTAGFLLWIFVGIAGVSGFFAGDAVGRIGLRQVLFGGFVAMSAAMILLGAAPLSWLTAGASAVLFGASVMVLGALFAVWSSEVFGSRAGAGLSAVTIVATLGQIAGSVAAGFVAGSAGLGVAFVAAGALALAAGFIRPRNGETAPEAEAYAL